MARLPTQAEVEAISSEEAKATYDRLMRDPIDGRPSIYSNAEEAVAAYRLNMDGDTAGELAIRRRALAKIVTALRKPTT